MNARHDLSMLVGFALFQVWVTLCFFTPQLFPDQAATGAWHVYEKSLLVSVLALVPCALLHVRVAPLLRRPSVRWGLAGCAALGTLLIPLSLRPDGLGLALALIAAVFSGIASGLLNLTWCQEFAERGNPVDFTLSVVTSSVIIYVLTNLIYTPSVSPWATLALSVAAPLAAVGLLGMRRAEASDYGQLAAPLVVSSRRGFVARLCVGIFVISFADELLRNLYLDGTDLSFYASQVNLVVLLLKVAVSAMVVSDIRRGRRDDFSFLFRASFLLALISALLLPYSHETADVAYAITNCGAFLFKLTVLLATLELCARHDAPSVLVFAVVRAVWSLDLLLGSTFYSVGSVASGGSIIAAGHAGALSIVLAVVIAVAYLFVFANEAGPLARLREAHEGDAGAPAGGSASEDEGCGSNGGSRAGAGEAPGLRGHSSKAGRVLTMVEGCAGEEGRDLDVLCDELAGRGRLSAREVDVLRLLARGRTTVRIEAELGISSNTVNTHVKHVFQKLGVHSRQELLDLLEHAARVDDLDDLPVGLR